MDAPVPIHIPENPGTRADPNGYAEETVAFPKQNTLDFWSHGVAPFSARNSPLALGALECSALFPFLAK